MPNPVPPTFVFAGDPAGDIPAFRALTLADMPAGIGGGAEVIGNPGSGTFPGITLGARTGQTDFVNIAYGEVLAFARLLTPDEEAALFAYLRSRWGHY